MPSFFLPHIERMSGYVPGEQPSDPSGILKLNTNENPYPPSPRVAEAIARGLDGRLRLYPDPMGNAFRRAAAKLHGVEPGMILVGNGSDDLLTIVTRAFAGPGDTVLYPTPSYILYKTLAEIQGARPEAVPFRDDWTLDPDNLARPEARLTFLANPNSPSGTLIPTGTIRELAAKIPGPFVVDEAYGDFAESSAVGLVESTPNLIVMRTLSKGYGLAGLRLGYLIASREIVEGLSKVKDSYNADALSLLGGQAAIEDQAYLQETRSKIVRTRRRLADRLRAVGYRVPESHANFVWCEGGPPASGVYESLKTRKILVRLMRYPNKPEGLRITVGTDEAIDRFLAELESLR
ncbi:MAG: histidinol-phosphate transaminase [Isosphaeraceae bacterium]